MDTFFNVAEKGAGSYRLLAVLRWVMVVIFVSFGMQKFTLQSAQGIVQFISNSPFISWLSVFGLRGEAYGRSIACEHASRQPVMRRIVHISWPALAWSEPLITKGA